MKPTTLQEAVIFFSDPVNCREWIVPRRWPEGVICPRCGGKSVKFLEKYNRWQCGARHASRQFTVKTGTIFEDSPLGIDKWLMAMWQVVNDRNGISSYEMARTIGVSQKSTWFMDHRIRHALNRGSFETMLGGEGKFIEADETFVGGKAINMHKKVRIRRMGGKRGGADAGGKTIVMGMLERGGEVRTKVLSNRKKPAVQGELRKHVQAGSAIFTDELQSYHQLTDYQHEVINHAVECVRGNVHTNGMENFWSLVKRALKGTYISVEPFHLFRYLDEQMYRYNNRKDENGDKVSDFERFDRAVRQIVGKRLTWDTLTGQEAV
jgi:transposase-like protein